MIKHRASNCFYSDARCWKLTGKVSVLVSVVGSCSLVSNSKLSSSASDEEMNAILSILAAVRVEPCRLTLDDILLQGKLYLPVDQAYRLVYCPWGC